MSGPARRVPGRRRLPLAGVQGPIAAGRDFTREALADWEWPPVPEAAARMVVADVVLVVSELLTNAALHGSGPRELVVELTESALRVEVADGEPAKPEPRSPHEPGVPGGHGLHIVEKLCDRWGVTPREDGKIVWLEVDTSRYASVE